MERQAPRFVGARARGSLSLPCAPQARSATRLPPQPLESAASEARTLASAPNAHTRAAARALSSRRRPRRAPPFSLTQHQRARLTRLAPTLAPPLPHRRPAADLPGGSRLAAGQTRARGGAHTRRRPSPSLSRALDARPPASDATHAHAHHGDRKPRPGGAQALGRVGEYRRCNAERGQQCAARSTTMAGARARAAPPTHQTARPPPARALAPTP